MVNVFFETSKIPLLDSPAPFFFCSQGAKIRKKEKKRLVVVEH
jgi:hypothetical protein